MSLCWLAGSRAPILVGGCGSTPSTKLMVNRATLDEMHLRHTSH